MVNTASPGRCLVYSYIQKRSGLYKQEYRKRSSAHRRCYGTILASPYSAQTFGCVIYLCFWVRLQQITGGPAF